MTEYDHYVTYRNATDQIRERVAQSQRPGVAGLPRHPHRQSWARRLHAIADRLDT